MSSCRHCAMPILRHQTEYSQNVEGQEIVACSEVCLSAAVRSWKQYRASVAHLPDPRPRRVRLLELLRRAVAQ